MHEPRAVAGRTVARLVNKADFERLLAARWHGRSAHFALHHVSAAPAVSPWVSKGAAASDLSTALAPPVNKLVDNLPEQVWFGCVVPKRHARRAVTRSLLKRQMRGAFQRHGPGLAGGLWLVRLRSSFAVAQFVSAGSTALAVAARSELDGLLAQAAA
jgi:ribonuclease P protein component